MTGKRQRISKKRRVPYTKFKAWMAENGVKQKHLAELLGKQVSTISAKLNGESGDFSMPEVRKICETYNISSDTYFVHQKVS